MKHRSSLVCLASCFLFSCTSITKRSTPSAAALSLEEKARLLSGDGAWQTHAIPRVNLPSIRMADGPHGLRKASGIEFGQSVPATAFPTLSALGATWNTELIARIGAALGKEAQASDVQILLGPAINMKRSPLAGRNFEYFSEDPYLTGKLAAAYVNGLQGEGVGASLKHFAVNNQELERMAMSSNLDERTLREIYLAAFEIVVKEAQPWTVMAAYNRVNGINSSENSYLLQSILRDEWGFKGFVISDWGAVADRVRGVNAGLALEMPGSGAVNRGKIIEAVERGEIAPARLDQVISPLLDIIERSHRARKVGASFNKEDHHALAREAAGEAIVLLKNHGDLLPIDFKRHKRIAIIGAFAKTPRIQGAGSSQVAPTLLSNVFDELAREAGASATLTFAQGYDEESGATNSRHLAEATRAARESDLAIVFAGLPDSYESEGFDRATMRLPKGHDDLIATVIGAQPKTVVVLTNGSAVEMPWLAKARAVVEGWLTGQAGGAAMADVLTGKINPSGKLSESFPARLRDTSTYDVFPAKRRHAEYKEGERIGYRHHDATGIKPLFPFGFGLSYTEFAYADLRADRISDSEIAVQFAIRNKGQRAGSEVAQVYIRDPQSSAAIKSLRAFAKTTLKPGESKLVNLKLGRRDFSFYDRVHGRWTVRGGSYEILVGGSSALLPLRTTINLSPDLPPLSRDSMVKDFREHPKGKVHYLTLLTSLGLDPDAASKPAPSSFTPEQVRAKKKGEQSFLAYMNDLPVGRIPALSEGRFSELKLDEILRDISK